MVEFFKKTMIRGVMILLPFLLVFTLLGVLYARVGPVAVRLQHLLLPWTTTIIGSFSVALAGLLASVFLVGWFGLSIAGSRFQDWFDRQIEQVLPSYGILRRSLLAISAGREQLDGQSTDTVVLVRVGDMEVLGLITERRADGRCAVYLPDAPSGMSG